MSKKKIIFFDGVCVLCNGLVDFLLTHDKKGLFLFAALQGKTAKEKLNKKIYSKVDSIVLLDGSKIYTKSTAVLKILSELGGIWYCTKIFFIIPRFIRDFVYQFIVRYRYRVFGKKNSCRMPTKDEEERFLY